MSDEEIIRERQRLQVELDALKQERRSEEKAWRTRVDASLSQTIRCVQEVQAEQTAARATIVAVHVDVSTLKTVVCGAPGKEADGMSARLWDVEKHIGATKARRSRSFWLATGAFLVALLALGKDVLVRKMFGP